MCDLRQKILDDHPWLYIHGFYMECQTGWDQLIYDLSSKLEPLAKKYNLENKDDEYFSPIYAESCKEKYGTLRYSLSNFTEEMYKIVNEYEALSRKTCEFCGKPGELKNTSWISCYCPECYKSYLDRVGRKNG